MALHIGAREGDAIRIGDDIELVIVKARGGWVKVSITAPSDVSVRRCPAPRHAAPERPVLRPPKGER
jgi:hypothetical protein